MEFGVKVGPIETQKTDCVIVGVFDSGHLSAAAEALDRVSGGFIYRIVKAGDLEGKAGQTQLLHHVPHVTATRVLLVGCGKEKEFNETQYRRAVAKAVLTLESTASKDCICYLSDLTVGKQPNSWNIAVGTQTAHEAIYRFDELKSIKEKIKHPVKKLFWPADDKKSAAKLEPAIAQGRAIALGVAMAKDLGNLPGNICTPSYLADQAKKLQTQYSSIKTKILDEAEMEKLGMGALLSVSKGSREPAKLIIMTYSGGKKDKKPVVLVGKGLTFDAGGISIKPAAAMDEMKYDMCGGASVLGTMKAVAELGLAINVIGVVPSSENLPDGAANKPGDIVTSMSGQTIEILNTDAEGRLILCDALTYSERFNPSVVIDIATLTGACVIALGKHASGLLSNHQPLADDLRVAGEQCNDRTWQMPLWEEYQEQLKSNFADMANVGGREAGTITAACFLARYTKKFHWAHLDIAGTAWLSGGEKGSTGRPVPLLTQYLINRADN